ncbi:helix-turn-helix domain-containing protein [Tessaracoccus sp. Y36]|uniref:Helix-turn-helix domain protein n=1 Tax=Microbacterium ginsengisoli TaxID=400772 RepID=A0A0F0LT40_9MICO|nr:MULTISPECIES: helix-turn-helix domain-containing protein [Actinomycetes]KJL36412.1 Helix-turn-helix domain protein [Microbacterium ginsengisoli]MDI9960460.1 helix-turn-helix domain-containing protein [Rhodococcus sp. IEGM 1237]MDI9966288.1 helix-turn-helix domain-containing protein [Rhodococcus sp. IEGM 1251]MDV8128624.1 helix-turn-helix domain-containing protein [Rhodococcus sp. IEGM 1304]MEE1622447.1 helix-turn-helix domain-containing protein [Zafaria sp. J156]
MNAPTVVDHGAGPVETLWCARDVAEFLNVSQATLSRWRREKIGPPFLRVGGVSRYTPATVRAWVTEQENDHG